MGKLGKICAAVMLWSAGVRADEAIDLSQLGGGGFHPYPRDVDRNALWIVLPLSIFFLVCLHLRKGRRVAPDLPPLESEKRN